MAEQNITIKEKYKTIGKFLNLNRQVANTSGNDNIDDLQHKLSTSSLQAKYGNTGNPIHNSFLILFLLFSLYQTPTHAFDKPVEQNYFASLRASETNVRAGPSSDYSIKFTYKMRGIPVKVISEYDNWNEIKDYDGDSGWVNQNLLTKKRMVMVRTAKTFVNLHAATSEKSKIILRIENNVVGDFIRCNGNWCGIKVAGKKGWVEKEDLWGVDENDSK